MKLKDLVVVITGAGRGIGRAIAIAAAREGAATALIARSQKELEDTAKEARDTGNPVFVAPADVSNVNDIHLACDAILSQFGRTDVLINNAAKQGPIGALIENDADEWIHTMQVNLVGPMALCKKFLPGMIERRKGKIINLSGGGATAPRPRFSAYATSKAGLVRFTEVLAEEVKRSGIDVNAVAPGAINTSMLDEVLEAGSQAGIEELNRAMLQKEQGGSSLERVQELVVFLASSASDGLTGKLISAAHDPWQDWMKNGCFEISESPIYTLRRLDPFTIQQLTRERRRTEG
jgi:3-oxoacyl-[acyl-carrier protein] reductase